MIHHHHQYWHHHRYHCLYHDIMIIIINTTIMKIHHHHHHHHRHHHHHHRRRRRRHHRDQEKSAAPCCLIGWSADDDVINLGCLRRFLWIELNEIHLQVCILGWKEEEREDAVEVTHELPDTVSCVKVPAPNWSVVRTAEYEISCRHDPVHATCHSIAHRF